MILSPNVISSVSSSDYDIIIFGSGPASYAISKYLNNKNSRILIVEAGDFDFSDTSNNYYKGTQSGNLQYPLDHSRLRFLGGTSNHWGGTCRYLDEIDFESKLNDDNFKWPINKSHLDKHYQEALKILDIKSDISSDSIFLNTVIKKIHYKQSPPTRFKDKFIKLTENNSNLDLILNINLKYLKIDHNKMNIKKALVCDYDGNEYELNAKKYVLALGGIENNRQLLLTNKFNNSILDRENNLIGRFWTDHLSFEIGHAFVTNDLIEFNSEGWCAISFIEDFIRKNNFTNAQFHFSKIYDKKYKKKELKSFKKNTNRKTFKYFSDQEKFSLVKVACKWEQIPSIKNKITLSDKLDSFGLNKVHLDWRLSIKDFQNLINLTYELNDIFINKDFGRFRLSENILTSNFDDNHIYASYHHIGGTRMSNDSMTGVVDENCKVHNIENLFIAGSSVFPSCGFANPTFSIVQTSLKTARSLIS